MNPVIPLYADVTFTVVSVLALALVVASIVSIALNARRLGGAAVVPWLLLVVFVPVVGPAAWWLFGFRQARRGLAGREPEPRRSVE